jgi:hypothetical protein
LRLTTIAAVTVSALTLVAGVQAGDSATVIKLLSVQVSQKQPNAKTFVVNDTDLIDGKKVGHDTLTCRIVSQAKGNCSVVFTMRSGKLTGRFVISFSASSGKGSITGGSGKYAGAKGSFTYKNLNAKGTRTRVVLTLS